MSVGRNKSGLQFRTTLLCEAGILAANLLTLLLPLVIVQLFDRVIPNQATETLTILGLILAGAIALEALLRASVGHLMAVAGERYELVAQDKMIDHILSAPEKTKADASQLDYLEALDTIQKNRVIYAGNNRNSVFDVPFSVLCLLAFWYVAPPLFFAMLCVLAVALLGNSFSRNRTLARSEDLRDKRKRTSALSMEILAGIEHLKGMRAEPFMLRRIESLFGNSARSTERLVLIKSIGRVINEIVAQATPLIIGLFGALAALEGSITSGALAASILLSGRIVQPFLRQQQFAEQKSLLAPSLKSLIDVTSAHKVRRGANNYECLETLELRDLGFVDVDQRVLLRSVNLTLNAGDVVAISGDSGVGKSLLLKLIAGSVAPTSGQILINAEDMTAQGMDRFWHCISIMNSNFNIPTGKALDILTGFGGQHRLAAALPIIEELGLSSFFANHPKGFSAEVGSSVAWRIPSSVQGRLSLVPAFMRNPDLLLFDEANGALDFESDQLLLSALKRRRGEMSMIIVTQRPSYIAMADRHFQLADGSLALVAEHAREASSKKTASA